MLKPENKIHKIPWDSEIQMDRLIPVRRSVKVLINKTKEKKEFAVLWILPPYGSTV